MSRFVEIEGIKAAKAFIEERKSMVSKKEELQMNSWWKDGPHEIIKAVRNKVLEDVCTIDDRVSLNSPAGVTIHCPVHPKGHFIRGNTRINHIYHSCIMHQKID